MILTKTATTPDQAAFLPEPNQTLNVQQASVMRVTVTLHNLLFGKRRCMLLAGDADNRPIQLFRSEDV